MNTANTYTGPVYYMINALSEREWAVIEQPSGIRIGIYPGVEVARHIAKNADAIALREYLKAQRKAQRKATK